MVKEPKPIWFRQRAEPIGAYDAFKIYRGTLNRGDDDTAYTSRIPVNNATRQHHRLKAREEREWTASNPVRDLHRVAVEIKASYKTVLHYCTRYDWVNRAAAYDEFLDETMREEIRMAMRLKVVTCLKLRDQFFEECVRTAAGIKAEADELMKLIKDLHLEKRHVERRYEDGRPHTTIVLKPVKWRVSDIIKLYKFHNEMMNTAFELALGKGHEEPTVDVEHDPLPPEVAAQLMKIGRKQLEYDGDEDEGDVIDV